MKLSDALNDDELSRLAARNLPYQLKVAYPHKFNEWTYLGEIDREDIELIIGTVKESPRESAEHLAQFGL